MGVDICGLIMIITSLFSYVVWIYVGMLNNSGREGDQ